MENTTLFNSIITRLGERVSIVELTQEHVDESKRRAEQKLAALYNNVPDKFHVYWIEEYTLALCMEILGLIRSKMKNIPVPGHATIQLNGEHLIQIGISKQDMLFEELKYKFGNKQ